MKTVIHKSDVRITCTNGHVVLLRAGVPTEVPDVLFQACLDKGARLYVPEPVAEPVAESVAEPVAEPAPRQRARPKGR